LLVSLSTDKNEVCSSSQENLTTSRNSTKSRIQPSRKKKDASLNLKEPDSVEEITEEAPQEKAKRTRGRPRTRTTVLTGSVSKEDTPTTVLPTVRQNSPEILPPRSRPPTSASQVTVSSSVTSSKNLVGENSAQQTVIPGTGGTRNNDISTTTVETRVPRNPPSSRPTRPDTRAEPKIKPPTTSPKKKAPETQAPESSTSITSDVPPNRQRIEQEKVSQEITRPSAVKRRSSNVGQNDESREQDVEQNEESFAESSIHDVTHESTSNAKSLDFFPIDEYFDNLQAHNDQDAGDKVRDERCDERNDFETEEDQQCEDGGDQDQNQHHQFRNDFAAELNQNDQHDVDEGQNEGQDELMDFEDGEEEQKSQHSGHRDPNDHQHQRNDFGAEQDVGEPYDDHTNYDAEENQIHHPAAHEDDHEQQDAESQAKLEDQLYKFEEMEWRFVRRNCAGVLRLLNLPEEGMRLS